MPVKSRSNRDAVLTEIERGIVRTVEKYADDTLRIVQDLYRSPKHGRLYGVTGAKLKAYRRFRAGRRKTAPRGLHRASQTGEAPAIETGALRKGTTRTEVVRLSRTRWSVALGVALQSGRATRGKDGMSVAERLELGSKGGRIGPRPAWRTALEIMRANGINSKG